MQMVYDKFQIVLLSEVKGKDKNAFIFELRLTDSENCRVKIAGFEAFDIEGNKFTAELTDISVTDIILGHSKFFTETKKVNVKIGSGFKSKIGCMAVLTVVCIEDKKKMSFCFQRKGTNRWDCVGIEFLEYDIPEESIEPVQSDEAVEIIEAEENAAGAETVEAVEGVVKAESIEAVEGAVKAESIEVVEDAAEAETVEGTEQAEPMENAEIATKKSFEALKEDVEREGLEAYLEVSMNKFLSEYELGEETVGAFLEVFSEMTAKEADNSQTVPAENVQPLEPAKENDIEWLEEYLNSVIEFDEKSAELIGLAVDNLRIRLSESNDKVMPVLYCEVSYSKETYVLVRCPMIKAIFYDEKESILNMSMHSVSRIHTGQDIVEMPLKKSTFKYWSKLSKIKILVTI